MSWSPTFLAELDRTVSTPVYRLRTVKFGAEPYGGYYLTTSAPGYGEAEVLIAGPPTIQGPRLSTSSWTCTIGQISIPIAGDIARLLTYVTRGSTLVLEMGFLGWSTSDFEVIAVGRFVDAVGSYPNWTIICDDMLSMLRSRFTTEPTQFSLFSELGTATTLGADYTAGDATVTVADTTGFSFDASSEGAFLVTPTTGDAFILFYSGKTGTTFTFCSAAVGTTAVDAAFGDTVTDLVYLHDHPMDIARDMLLADGSNYPATWGWGIPSAYLDLDDIEQWKTNVVKVASGSYVWDYIQPEEAEDPYAWIADFLSDAGIFLTVRQGLLTIRAGQAHAGASTAPYMPDLEITDADIESCDFVSLFDSNTPIEYSTVAAVTHSGTLGSGDAVQTLPAMSTPRTYDVADRVYSNEAAIRTEMTGRLKEMSTRIPEVPRVVLRGLKWSQLAPGDVLPLTTHRLRGRLTNTRDGYDGRRVYVIQATADHAANRTTVTAYAYPTDDEVFPE